jgi:hypothetical protein
MRRHDATQVIHLVPPAPAPPGPLRRRVQTIAAPRTLAERRLDFRPPARAACASAWDITADDSARTIAIVVAVGGNFFGGPGAPAETIILTHLADGVIQGTSPAFGEISGTVSTDGMLDITLSGVPGGAISKVDITGAFSGGDTISIDYTVTFAGGGATASGTVSLTKA